MVSRDAQLCLTGRSMICQKGSMFVIESTNAMGWRWLSGIFALREHAEHELSAISDETRPCHRLVEAHVGTYPFFVLEDRRGFKYLTLAQALATLDALEPKGDEDHVHLNLYAIRCDFRPSTPGVDELGVLPHWHVTDDTLGSPRREAFDDELVEIGRGA